MDGAVRGDRAAKYVGKKDLMEENYSRCPTDAGTVEMRARIITEGAAHGSLGFGWEEDPTSGGQRDLVRRMKKRQSHEPTRRRIK